MKLIIQRKIRLTERSVRNAKSSTQVARLQGELNELKKALQRVTASQPNTRKDENENIVLDDANVGSVGMSTDDTKRINTQKAQSFRSTNEKVNSSDFTDVFRKTYEAKVCEPQP